ncbi:uncharacterized protein LOC118194020, partial [Stegodyphus dumicola]|uniref:uncharacterized protein LOC118194020 n=1 Tax=Stegodyphus dumicola TaxID=202533 RepID=UPI0015AC264F
GPNFWKNNQPSFTKICLYSNDPSQFTPVCIMCPNTLYPIVLTTCVMGAAIPLNVSYTQANCIVGNCAVNMSPSKFKIKRDASEETKNTFDSEKLATKLLVSDLPEAFEDDSHVRSVPYTMMVDGHNVTITSIEEYFVHSDYRPGDDVDDEELE